MGMLVDILGLSVNVMTDRELLGLLKMYLENDYMNTIYIYSVDTCYKMAFDDELISIMNESDVCLPAEKLMFNKKYRLVYKGVTGDYKSFLDVLKNKAITGSMYLIGKNSKITGKLVDVFGELNAGISICGSHSTDSDDSPETVVNEINSLAPEMIVLALDTPDVQSWMKSHRQMLNSKLCIVLCDISETIAIEYATPDSVFQKLYYNSIVKLFMRKKYTENKRKERIFQTLMAEYNEKKE